MITMALLALMLDGIWPTPKTKPSRARIEAVQDYQDCLDDRDLTPEDNDGECEEP